jgi:RNA polymerase sigma-70 factor (ECF subfamily)
LDSSRTSSPAVHSANPDRRRFRSLHMPAAPSRATMNEVNPLRLIRGDSASLPVDELASALQSAARGDEAAFGRVYDLTCNMVYGIARRVVRDPEMAAEVTQEVYVGLWSLAPRFDPIRGSARGLIATMAHRRAVDRVRSEQSRRDREDADGRRAVGDFDTVAEAVGDQLDRERVRHALDTLSNAQREAVTLAYYEGHTYREVAALLDVAEGTVKTRIRDGMMKLRDHLGITE